MKFLDHFEQNCADIVVPVLFVVSSAGHQIAASSSINLHFKSGKNLLCTLPDVCWGIVGEEQFVLSYMLLYGLLGLYFRLVCWSIEQQATIYVY